MGSTLHAVAAENPYGKLDDTAHHSDTTLHVTHIAGQVEIGFASTMVMFIKKSLLSLDSPS